MHQKVTCRPCFRIPLGPNKSNCPNLPWPRDEWQVHRSTQLFKTYLESYYYPFLSRATSHHLDDTISSLEKQHSVNHNFCPRVYFFTNVVNHVSTNFERRTIDYIFIQFTNWTTGFWKRFPANHRTFVKCAYYRADTEEGNWRSICNNSFERADIDSFVSSIDIGPTSVTTVSLEANGNQYFLWLYQILQRLGNGHDTRASPPNLYFKSIPSATTFRLLLLPECLLVAVLDNIDHLPNMNNIFQLQKAAKSKSTYCTNPLSNSKIKKSSHSCSPENHVKAASRSTDLTSSFDPASILGPNTVTSSLRQTFPVRIRLWKIRQ